ncbi:NAC domain-containing protein 35-like [Diospyros lotus]|uniref:NAC domain-containing protein 35-like n=1 Tax=Diospyros lotus TaxID=55363 RepID=UPI0022587A8C|nr:NAC domain-containing protein 35-like [Diospyros lotus]
MAIAATMSSSSQQDDPSLSKDDDVIDQHEHDTVMPGFRFHPTEEELIDFYLRRKVEGKRFNVELITFLDLYRYDPWELPAMAAIGEKEWFFYVPRDRKYRNGDRPNRVTTSGYWKATGADRTIRGENSRSIGLKKTLVFYSGKAPKGIRTSWIMNEYRLPHHETERLQKAEISLCRVYKRPGVEDHHHLSLPRSLLTRASSSKTTQMDKMKNAATSQATMERSFQALGGPNNSQVADDRSTEKMSETSGSSSTDVGLSKHNYNSYMEMAPMASMEQQSKQLLIPNCTTVFTGTNPNFNLVPQNYNYNSVDELHRLVSYHQQQGNSIHHHYHHQQQQQHFYYNPSSQFSTLQPQPQPQPLPQGALQAAFLDSRLWDWSAIDEGNKDYTSPFK